MELENAFDPENVSLSPTTLRTYQSGWRDYVRWCREEGVAPSPANPESIANFLEARRELSVSALKSRRAAVQHVCRTLGADDPFGSRLLDDVWQSVTEPSEQRRSARNVQWHTEGEHLSEEEYLDERYHLSELIERGPALVDAQAREIQEETVVDVENHLTRDFRRMLPYPALNLNVLRDRAILLLLISDVLSPQELTRLRIRNVQLCRANLSSREKRNQERRPFEQQEALLREQYYLLLTPGREPYHRDERPHLTSISFPMYPILKYCPVRAVVAWRLASDIHEGPLFRSVNRHNQLGSSPLSTQSLHYLVKRRAEEAGYDPATWTPGRIAERHPRPWGESEPW